MTADVVVTRGKDSWTIARKSLAPLISFSTAADGTITTVFDESGLDPIVKTLAKDVNRSAKDAGLRLVGRHIVATGTSHEGRTLIADGMKAALISEIEARQTGAAATPVEAVVKAVDPKLTTADAKAFAPKMKVISSYSVWYQHIVNNHFGGNIEGPATVLNGTVVPAGAKFDFWKEVGNLRNAPGVGPGNAIEGGKITVTGAFGGGICTTSTTLFNAAFRAGMVPLARKNHNEFISRYPPGLDATVWIVGNTKQTMSFKNDTKYPIMITRVISRSGGKYWLTFKIWSVPNGRKATVTNTVIQPGERAIHKTVKDPTKPVGYTLLQQRRGGRRQGVDHRDDLRPRQGPLEQALLLELPSRGRRHDRRDQDLTLAESARRIAGHRGRKIAPMSTSLKPRIFLGSSTQQAKLLAAVSRGLEDIADIDAWTTVFNPGVSTLDRLVELTHEVDFAAFVFAQDDWTSKGPAPDVDAGQASPRDNVVFEAGLFGGALGMRRTFILHARGAPSCRRTSWA